MNALIASLAILASAATLGVVYTDDTVTDLVPAASTTAGTTAIQNVVRAARYITLIDGGDWAASLATVETDLIDGHINVDGTTVRWHDGIDGCWEAAVPTAWTPVHINGC
jgi:hypothetical protein